uniref:Uncharacterized mitochondrial protein AtMg00810-like n=1 Tax=Nicotiana tabacum TaxID=4097 RepID=A0A1S3ZQG8_TOBAC|nr:PREDICTED: uncharacterized mitochondrial protein AtMg00810-like [Nicotiana tabacum]
MNNAFLHGNLHEEVYMKLPQGLAVSSLELVCKLNKFLYGLKQASRQWYAKLTEALYSRGYIHSMYDYPLFYKRTSDRVVFVGVYVDDVLLTGNDLTEIQMLKTFLYDQFKIKDLVKLYYFLGLEVLYRKGGILISQRKFTLDRLKEYDYLHATSLSSPLDPITKLKAKEGVPLSDPTFYTQLVGKLNFLTNTRLDIAYGVYHLNKYMQDLREPHLQAAYHMLRYLLKDPTLGLFMSSDNDFSVKAYCDSDWAACPNSRKLVSGYLILLANSPISWKSKKKETISLSSVEVEYRSIRKVVGELVWLHRMLTELTVPPVLPIPVFCGSQYILHIARNPVFHERTKHIEVDCYFVRTKLTEGLILLQHIRTGDQLADILTKSLTGIKHSTVLGKLALCSPPPT